MRKNHSNQKNAINLDAESTLKPTPKLALPGAGLPLLQRLYLRFWVGPVTSKRIARSESRKSYEIITKKIIEIVTNVRAELRNQRVLVDPIFGLEDSSRFWSLNEVLEHLIMVSRNIEAVIIALSSGVIPNVKVDIAKFKPIDSEQDRLPEFINFAPELVARIDEKFAQPNINIHSHLKLSHPWFGPFTASQWYWLLSSHQGIHYKQIKGIIAGLQDKL